MTRRCRFCNVTWVSAGRPCPACRRVLDEIKHRSRSEFCGRGHPVAGQAERVARYAARAAEGKPLFTAADRARRADPCE